jgi:hypothetical protein
MRILIRPRDFDATGPAALIDLSLTLVFFGIVIGSFLGIGSFLISGSRTLNWGTTGRLIGSFALGSGLIGYLVLAMGLLGLLSQAALSILLALCIAIASPHVWKGLEQAPDFIAALRQGWRTSSVPIKIIISLSCIIGLLSFLNALGPPWDYDGLMYHLLGPKIFLEAERLIPNTDNWFINGPFTIEMLFTLGMAFGDDVFPKLVHFAYGILYVGATWFFARRWLSRRGAWYAVGVLLTVPTVPVWASFAYIDLGWSAYEILALGSLIEWMRSKDNRWLVFAGGVAGLAMGTKYLGLIGFAILGSALVLASWKDGWVEVMRRSLRFGLPAIVIAAPWYIKNAIWYGNPVYPFIFGGPSWPPEQLAFLTEFLNSFGTGRSLVDYLLLPINVYAQNARFGAVMNQIDIPSVLFPLAIVLPFRTKESWLKILLALAGVRFALWALGTQQVRFLMPVYPLLSIAVAWLIARMRKPEIRKLPWHIFFPSLVIGLMGITVFFQIQILREFNPIPTVLGMESRGAYLRRIVRDYAAVQDTIEHSNPGERILMLGDGRGYYCVPNCVPNPDHFRWAGQIAQLESPEALEALFQAHELHYLLLSIEDLDFLLQHDPTNTMTTAVQKIFAWRNGSCFELTYEDQWASVYRINCLET